MGRRRGARGRGALWVFGSVAIGLLLLAAAAAPDGPAFLDPRAPDQMVVPAPPLLFDILLILSFVGLVIAYLALRVRALKETGARRNRSFLPGFMVVAMVLAIWSASPTVQDWVAEGIDALTNGADDLQDGDLGPGGLQPRSSTILGYAVTIVLLLVIGAVVSALWWLTREPSGAPSPDEEQRQLLLGIDAGIDDLGSLADPRDAVIACYSRMQAAADLAGVPRRASDTPLEALARLLERHRVSESSSRRLTELFERAKFSTHPVDEDMRREAFDALLDVRNELGVTV